MRPRAWIALGALALAVAPVAALELYESVREPAVSEAKRRISQLQVGMTKEDVRRLVGVPERIRALHDRGEVWYYPAHFAAATVPNCLFDEAGKLTAFEY